MRAWIELDEESAGWRPARVKMGELRDGGYTVAEYICWDGTKLLIFQGAPEHDECPAR
jgi:hypothetical protein